MFRERQREKNRVGEKGLKQLWKNVYLINTKAIKKKVWFFRFDFIINFKEVVSPQAPIYWVWHFIVHLFIYFFIVHQTKLISERSGG